MSARRGIKALELRRCDLCGEGLCKQTQLPLFFRITVERMGVKANEVRRFEGLSMMLGSAQLAAVMGDDPDIAVPLGEPVEALLCDACAAQPDAVWLVLEKANDRSGANPSREEADGEDLNAGEPRETVHVSADSGPGTSSGTDPEYDPGSVPTAPEAA